MPIGGKKNAGGKAMGIIRRILQEILNIPLDEMRLQLFKDVLPEAPTEALGGTVAVLFILLFSTAAGLLTGVVQLAKRSPTPHVVALLVVSLVVGLLAVDTVADFLRPVLDELRERLYR